MGAHEAYAVVHAKCPLLLPAEQATLKHSLAMYPISAYARDGSPCSAGSWLVYGICTA